MKWQPHCLGDALPPPPRGGDESDHTQAELVQKKDSCEKVEFKAILFFMLFLSFSTSLALLKLKEHHQSF